MLNTERCSSVSTLFWLSLVLTQDRSAVEGELSRVDQPDVLNTRYICSSPDEQGSKQSNMLLYGICVSSFRRRGILRVGMGCAVFAEKPYDCLNSDWNGPQDGASRLDFQSSCRFILEPALSFAILLPS